MGISEFIIIRINPNTTENSYKRQKEINCKFAVIRRLRKSFKKHGKNIIKTLANVNKGATFAPATAIDVH